MRPAGLAEAMETAWEGIINLNKPPGLTSAKALYKVRSICRQRKSGHAGTLDPAASGVLVLCLGRATKLVERIMDQPKIYQATARLDVVSDSFDLERPVESVTVADPPSTGEILDACRSFEGLIEQVPPPTSAVKIAGQPAYKRAHRGLAVELAARSVRIYWVRLHHYKWPALDFEMCTGRGTYVRSFIRDLGARLKTGGCLTSLVRTRVGPFHLDDAWTIDEIATAADPRKSLIELEVARGYLETAAPEA